MVKFSLVIPTYNRQDVLVENLKKLRNAFPEAEIILVDDGSSLPIKDEIVKQFGNKIITLTNEKNLGKGAALRKGFLAAQGDFIIFTDDDLPYGIKGIQKILDGLLKNNVIIIGERVEFLESIFKHLVRNAYKLLIKLFLRLNLNDTQAGLKGFPKEIGKKLFQLSKLNDFGIDFEILYLASRLRFPIKTVPVEVINNAPSHFSLLKLIFNTFKDIIKIKLTHYEF